MNAAQLAARKIKAPTRRIKPDANKGGAPVAPLSASTSFEPPSGGNIFGNAGNSFNFSSSFQPSFNSATPDPSAPEDPRADTTGEEAARQKKPFQGFGSGTASPAPPQPGGLFGQASTSFGGPPSNSFGSAAPQPPPQSNSFTFGANNNQSQPAPVSFQFGQSSQPPSTNAGGFNFNATAPQAAPVNNPFSFSQPPASTPSAGFGTSQADKPAPFSFGATQSPAPSSNIFGGLNTGANAAKPAIPSLFGQPQSQEGSQSGSQPASRPETPSLFGGFGNTSAPPPAQDKPAPAPFSFGQSLQPPTAGAPAQDKPAATPFSFGQSQPPATAAPSPDKPAATPFSFGQSQPPTTAAPSPDKPAATPFSFGQTQPPTTAAPAQDKPAATPFSFGQTQPPTTAAPAQDKPAAAPFGFGQAATTSLFGQPSATSAPSPNPFSKTTPAAPSTNLFGQPAQQNAPATPSIFGQQSQAAPAPANNIFGKPPTGNPFANIKIPEAAPAPTSNLFGSQVSRSVSPEKDMADTEDAPAPPSNLFGASAAPSNQPQGQDAQPATSLFGKPAQDSASPAKNIFGQLPGVSPSKNTLADEQNGQPKESPFAAQNKPTTNLFGGTMTSEAASPSKPSQQAGTTSLFGAPKFTDTASLAVELKPSEADKPTEPSNALVQSIESPLPNGSSEAQTSSNTALSEITNGAKRRSQDQSADAAKPTEAPCENLLDTEKPEKERALFEGLINERSEDYDDSEVFAREQYPKIASLIAKYFISNITDRQQVEAFIAIKRRYLRRQGDLACADWPELSDVIRSSIENKVAYVNQWGRHELRKADQRQKEWDEWKAARGTPPKPKASVFGSPVKSSPNKVSSPNKPPPVFNGSTTPKAPVPQKNLFSPASAGTTDSPATKSKRKADVQLTKDDPTGDESGTPKSKKTNGNASATSNLFRDLVKNSDKPAAGTPEKPMFSLSKSTDESEKPRANPFASLAVPKSTSPAKNTDEPEKPRPNPFASLAVPKSASPAKNNDEQEKPRPNSFASLAVPKSASPAKNTGEPEKPRANPFASLPKPASPAKSSDEPEKPRPNPFASLAVPKSASPAKTSPLASPSKGAAPANPFQLKPSTPTAPSENAKPNPFQIKSEASAASPAPASGGFKPTLSTGSAGDFMSQFAQSAKKTEEKKMQDAKDDDWDEDEETEAEWEARYKKEQEEKKKAAEDKLKAKPAVAVPKFGQAQDTSAKDAEKADGKTNAAASPSKNMFGAASSADQTWKPDSPIKFAPAPSTTSNLFGSPFKAPLSASTIGTHPASPAPASGGSLFGSKTSAETSTPPASGSSLFGSKAPATSTSPAFGGSLFGNKAPTETSTPPTSGNPFTGLFGSKTPTESSTPSAPKTTGSIFGASTTDSPSKLESFTPVSAPKSEGTAKPEGENSTEKGEGQDSAEPGEPLPQMKNLATADEPGEEILFMQKANAKVFKDGEWAPGLVGMFKLLKNTETGRVRYLMRLDNGKPVLNKSFLPVVPHVTKKAVVIMMPADADAPKDAPAVEKWHVTVRAPEVAKEFADIIEKCKPT